MSTELTIWNKLINSGMTKAGAAGVMGNLYAESALNPKNLQNTYEKSLSYSDDTYTSAVDSGKYLGFAKDYAGYGLAQWTYWARKQNLLNFAKSKGVSIGDLNMQLDFLIKELKSDFPGVWNILITTNSVKEASNIVLFKYESPADQGTTAQNTRYNYGIKYYNMFSSNEVPAKSVAEIAQEVLAGKWGNGNERKTRLTAAGYDYTEVQNVVNDILSGVTIEQNDSKTIDISVTIAGTKYSGTLKEN